MSQLEQPTRARHGVDDTFAQVLLGLGASQQLLRELVGTLPKRLRQKCGATTRAGSECQAPVVWDKRENHPVNGRCRLHGGRL